jgi:hypothetical protein
MTSTFALALKPDNLHYFLHTKPAGVEKYALTKKRQIHILNFIKINVLTYALSKQMFSTECFYHTSMC